MTFDVAIGCSRALLTAKFRNKTTLTKQDFDLGFIFIERIGTDDQLADIFTKPLAKISLEYLRKQIMGWPAILSHGNTYQNRFESTGRGDKYWLGYSLSRKSQLTYFQ